MLAQIKGGGVEANLRFIKVGGIGDNVKNYNLFVFLVIKSFNCLIYHSKLFTFALLPLALAIYLQIYIIASVES